MTSNNFISPNGLPAPSGGFSSRRGAQNVKPLSFDALKQSSNMDNGAPTPRTSRSHLLAGLRTAPKTASAASFGLTSSTAAGMQTATRNTMSPPHGLGQDSLYNPPHTAMPQFGAQHHGYNSMMNQHYTVDQVLAPPEMPIDDNSREHMDPNLYAQLVATNMYLAQQQQRLQQQLRSVQAAALQFQQLNLSNPQLSQQQLALHEQQLQLQNMQQQLGVQAALSQNPTQQIYYNPMTGQYYIDANSASSHPGVQYAEQPMSPTYGAYQQQHDMPRLQVSPPPENQHSTGRGNTPPRPQDTFDDVAPLPPPSANAFRRGHKKANSLTPLNSNLTVASSGEIVPKSAGPKTPSFPLGAANGGYGPGQARAGEHPFRQPRGPPSLDELKAKPTAKHDGSKNFAARTRRSAVHNLVRAGLERRKGTSSSAGSMSPVSETAEDSITPITDNESDSGRSGSGSLVGEMECNSSHTSASGGWGAIGSDRPSSRQKGRNSVDSTGSSASGAEIESGSFANVFKHGSLPNANTQGFVDGQRKAPRLVLTSAEKRKASPTV